MTRARFRLARLADWAAYLPLLFLTIYALAPLAILLSNSFKGTTEIFAHPFLPPTELRWENYVEAWRTGRFGSTLANSLMLVGIVVPSVIVVSFPAGYILAREKSALADAIAVFLLIVSTFPVQIYLIPLFVFLSKTGLLDSRLILALVYVAKFSPFATFLLRAFIIKIPIDLEEAARIDGASEFRVLTTILVPIAWPVILTVGLITGLFVWNEFALAVTLIQDPALKPVSTSLFTFQDQYRTDWPLTNAGAVITVLIPLALFFFLQRRFIEGLTSGAVKT